MNTMDYLGIFLLMILENIFPPIPSELIVPAAGFAASPSQGKLNIFVVILVASFGGVLGNLPLYFIGRFFNKEKIIAWIEKNGKILFINVEDIEKADFWFDTHGYKAVLFGRLVPAVRSLISLPAGMSGMDIKIFALYSFIGSLFWTSILAFAGYFLGENYNRMEGYISIISKVVLVFLVIALLVFLKEKKTNE